MISGSADFTTDDYGNTVVAQQGACIAGTCQQCSYRGNPAGMMSCGPTDGLNSERTCVYPGILVNTHSSNWSPGLIKWSWFCCSKK